MKKTTVSGVLAAIAFLLAALALQLYFNSDHYFAMNRAKCSFTMIVLMGAALAAVAKAAQGFFTVRERQRMTLLDWCVLLFGCGSVVTCFLSRAPQLTFVGTLGMYVGAFTYMTGTLLYFVVSRCMAASRWTIGILLAGWTAIFLWTAVNQCGTDLFGMHNNMKPGDELGYVASMGNANSACDAFATMIPFALVLLIMIRRYLLAAVSFFGLFAAYSLGNEGVLVGLLAMMPFVVILALSGQDKVELAIKVLLLAGLSMALFHFLRICCIVKRQTGMTVQLSDMWTGEILSVISFALLVLYRRGLLVFTDRSLKLVRQLLSWTCVAVLVGFVAVSVVGAFHDQNFGSGRGAIWKGSVWAFRLYSPVEMILGQGSGMFAENVTLAYSMLSGRESDLSFATCHNSLLQALLCNGIIGLACLLLGLFALVRDWVRQLRTIIFRPGPGGMEYSEMVRVASFTGIMGYFGSSLVESTYPHTVILLYAMLALYRSCENAVGELRS